MTEVFKFDSEFQRKIVKLALEDGAFCGPALKYLEPHMFESDSLSWAWEQIGRELGENRTPTLAVLRDRVRDVQPVVQPRYQALLTAIEADVIREERYIRARLAEFIQRAIFVEAFAESRRLFNLGAVDQAISLMMRESSRAQGITFDVPDRGWFFENFTDRQRIRHEKLKSDWEHTYPTGIAGVDAVLDGGLSRGELGVWVADSKGGKSILLVHLAAFTSRACRARVLFILLEGSRFQTQNRLEALISGELYRNVKRGEMSPATVTRLMEEYQQLKELLALGAREKRPGSALQK